MALVRRGWVILFLSVLLLGGCGPTTPAPTAAPTTPPLAGTTGAPAAATAQTPPAATRVVRHAMGETKVPANPQRVAVLDLGALGDVLALGIKPVGAATGSSDFTGYLKGRLDGVRELGDYSTPNFEVLLGLKPDLIIGTKSLHEPVYGKLAQIAPTVLAEAEPSGDWKGYLRFVGGVLGKSAQAEQLLRDYDARTAEFKRRMGSRPDTPTVSLVRSRAEGVDIYYKRTFAGTVLTDAGLKRPPQQDKEEPFSERVSVELIPQLDADVLFWVRRNEQEQGGIQKMIGQPLWSQLNAAKQGRVYEVPFDVWVSGWNIIGANLLLDDLFKYLVEGGR